MPIDKPPPSDPAFKAPADRIMPRPLVAVPPGRRLAAPLTPPQLRVGAASVPEAAGVALRQTGPLTTRTEHGINWLYEGDRPVATAHSEFEAQRLAGLGRIPEVSGVPPGAVPRAMTGQSLAPDTFHAPINDALGRSVGFMEFVINPKEVQMRYPYVEEGSRGQGLGINAYKRLVDWALASGRTFVSETGKSRGALRVYDSLKRQGYDVERTGDVIKIRPPEE
jgi:hypothetical protein